MDYWRNWNWNFSMPRVEIPEITRCCFCLPLRHGLLVWGYFKQIVLLFLAYMLIRDMMRYRGGVFPSIIIVTIFILADAIFNFIFIIAGHLKHGKLYHIYYYFSIGYLITYLCLLIFFSIWYWYGFYHFSIALVLRITLEMVTMFLPIFFLQGYITLLVRTEVRKLANRSNFQFVNNAAEAACNMDLTNHILDGNSPTGP